MNAIKIPMSAALQLLSVKAKLFDARFSFIHLFVTRCNSFFLLLIYIT